jgi:uncharacterized protein YqeY
MKDGDIKLTIQEAMKAAMRAQEKERLGTIRLILAAIKQWEVDERKDLSNEQLLVILDKMVRQRKDSIKQYESAGRNDLAQKENNEIEVIQEFLPTPLTAEEIQGLVKLAVQEVGAQSVKDMAKVMGIIKPKVQGRADMGEVGILIKNLLSQAQ